MERFRTKRGTCFIKHGELRLDENYRGQFKRYYEGARSSKLGFVLVLASFTFFFWEAATIVLNDRWILPYFFGTVVAVVIFAYTIDHLRGFRRPETIPLDAITEIRVITGSLWTHRRFVVIYEKDNRPRKRRIRIQSRGFAFSKREFERAKQLFRSNGLSLTGDADRPGDSRQAASE